MDTANLTDGRRSPPAGGRGLLSQVLGAGEHLVMRTLKPLLLNGSSSLGSERKDQVPAPRQHTVEEGREDTQVVHKPNLAVRSMCGAGAVPCWSPGTAFLRGAAGARSGSWSTEPGWGPKRQNEA